MKCCRICKESKETTEFKKMGGHNNYDTICKVCYNVKNRGYGKTYKKTPHGWAQCSWERLTSRAGNRSGKNPSYKDIEVRMSKNEFILWAIPRYEKWIKEHEQHEIPTIDRMDSLGHYEIDNIQLLSKKDNIKKGNLPSTKEGLIRLIIREANKLEISLELVAELIIKEQKKSRLDGAA